MALLRPALVFAAAFSVLCGLAYPLSVTGIGLVAFPRQARGSLLVREGRLRGSELIGQHTEDPGYFWGRLSATQDAEGRPLPTNAANSSGSNLAPSHPELRKHAERRIAALRQADPSNTSTVPADLVTASASGLDPHISPAAAAYQVPRVARVRHLDPEKLRTLVRAHTRDRTLGFIGEPCVNVLELNLALESMR
ncbi:MAG: potassium-transporting ATPase subunit KdpC [Acidobacteria bacterium]|nr:potassium-transporting ATPase subunit KdpC [Acidobacteriota bacterium]